MAGFRMPVRSIYLGFCYPCIRTGAVGQTPWLAIGRRWELICDHAESAWVIKVQVIRAGGKWVFRLKVVQHIRDLETQRGAQPFGRFEVLRYSGVQIPESETSENASPARACVDTKDRAPELGEDGGGVGKHIDPRTTFGGIAAGSHGAARRNVIVRGAVARIGRGPSRLFVIGGVAASVDLAERLCIDSDVESYWLPTAPGEEWRDAPSAQNVAE